MEIDHISLFSGIGGFNLAAKWVGWNNVLNCEINPFAKATTKYYFPEAFHHHDIHTLTKEIIDAHKTQGHKTVISAGFPCQPFSIAGQRRGAEDNRYLWPETFRIIKQTKPDWVVLENVAGIQSMALPSVPVEVDKKEDLLGETRTVYELRNKFVLNQILENLETENFCIQTFVIPAAAVGAPHKRDRIWIVANAKSEQSQLNESIQREFGQTKQKQLRRTYRKNAASNTRCSGLQRNERTKSYEETGKQTSGTTSKCFEIPTWNQWPSQSPVCGRNDGLPTGLDGITFSKWRKESLMAYGNAIVPQVARIIFQIIDDIENRY